MKKVNRVNSNQPKKKKSPKAKLQLPSLKPLLLKLTLVGQSLASLTIKGYGYFHARGAVCGSLANTQFLIHQIRPGKKISFHINPTDPNKIEALPDENNVKKYQLISRGTECYTHPNHDRYNTYGLFMEPVPDAEPDNPLTTFTCKIERFVLPTDMVQCNPGTTYQKIEDAAYFYFNSVTMTYESIKKSSKIGYSYSTLMTYYVISLTMASNLNPSTYFNDQFMEMLMAQPYRELGRLTFAFFRKDIFNNNFKIALQTHGVALTVPEFLRRITHDSLPGYYFIPDPSGDNGRFAHFLSGSYVRITKTYSFELYLSDPQNMDANNVGVLRYKLDHRFNTMQLIRVNYQFHIKKIGSNINIQMKRIDVTDDTTVLNTLTIDIPFTKTDEYVHFGFTFGIAHLYYKTSAPTTMMIRVYETLFGWHDGNNPITNARYDTEGPYQSVISGGHTNELSDFQYSNYNDRAMTSQNSQNIFGLRYLAYSGLHGAYPSLFFTNSVTYTGDRLKCMYPGIFSGWCNSWAFQTKRGASSKLHTRNVAFLGRYSNNPLEKCLIGYRLRDCLIPKPGYNRDLVIERSEGIATPVYLISDFEGSSQAAIDLRKDRAKFTDNLGLDYWVKCPPECIIF